MKSNIISRVTASLAVLVTMLGVASAQTENRQMRSPPSMHYIINIDRSGVATKEVSIGFPQVVDQHLGLNWVAKKLSATQLAALPAPAVSSSLDVSTMQLANAEATLHNERLTLYPAMAQTLSAYLRAQGIQHSWIEIKQRVLHQGRDKLARSTMIVQPSGYWHASLTRIRATDRPLQILYATYRARRDVYSDWEPDQIPPIADPNEASGRIGLWANVKRLDTWEDITAPAKQTFTRVGQPLIDWPTFSNWESTQATSAPGAPTTLRQDYLWPARCVLDRTSRNEFDAARNCPNANDVKSLANNLDVDFVVLDYFRPAAWRQLPTATPGALTSDFKLTVNSRALRNICRPGDVGSYLFNQRATLTGTVRVDVDRMILSEQGAPELIQQFSSESSVNYPYEASYLYKREFSVPTNDSCGNALFFLPYGGSGRRFTLGFDTRMLDDPMGRYCTTGDSQPTFSLFLNESFITPAVTWWLGTAQGGMAGFLTSKDPLKFVGHEREPGFSREHYVLPPITSTFTPCGTPEPVCPPGYTRVNGACVIDTTSCPPNSVYNAALNSCLTCPLRGQVLTGDLQCVCPTCTINGVDATGVPACVRDPAPTNPVCQGTNSCSAIAAAVGYDRMQTLPGSTRDVPLYRPGCPTCPDGRKWNPSLGSCEQEILDRCTNIAGVQRELPPGMTEENGICTAQNTRRFCSCGDADVTVSPPGSLNASVLRWNEVGDLSQFSGSVRVSCTQFSNINNTSQNATYSFLNGRIVGKVELPRQPFLTPLCQ